MAYIEQKLQQISHRPNARIIDYFDFFAGTSTGALIISALLTPNAQHRPRYQAKDLVGMYQENCQHIFAVSLIDQITSLSGMINAKYSVDSFQAFLERYFGQAELKQLLKPCLVPVYEMTQSRNYSFLQEKAQYNKSYNFLLKDMCLSACTAASYFAPTTITSFGGQQYCFLDGAIFAINPSLLAYTHILQHHPSLSSKDLLILSLGTGRQTVSYTCEQVQHWGMKDWHYPITNMTFNATADFADDTLRKIFAKNPHQYLRIHPNIGKNCYTEMDDCHADYLHYLEKFAHKNLNLYQGQLDKFIASIINNQQPVQSTKKPTLNIANLLIDKAQNYAEKTAFIGFGERLNFKNLHIKSKYLASYLQSLSSVQIVAIMLPNVLALPISLFAAWKAGKTVVLLNPLLSSKELLDQLSDAKADVLIGSAYFADNLAKIIQKTSIKYLIDSRLDDCLKQPKRLFFNLLMSRKFRAVNLQYFSQQTVVSFSKALQLGKPRVLKVETNNEIALLQYTGGTSGVLKAAILSHDNLSANLMQLKHWLPEDMADKYILTALPLYHIFALMINCLLPVKNTMTSVLVANPRDIKQLVYPLKKYPIHIITGVNTLYNHLLSYPQFHQLNFSHLETCVAGGMALQAKTAQKWQEKTGCAIIQGYGLTETSPVISVQNYGQSDFNGSIGYPLLDTQVQIIDTHLSQSDQAHAIGEISVKGPQVMSGYWQHPELNSEVFTQEGYFRTGDLGYLDEKGQLFLVDRLKEMIIVSGFNVYPSEVEKTLNKHDDILESACVGRNDKEQGQKVVAFIVLNDGSRLSEQDIIDYASKHLSHYKVPKQIHFIDNLPKNNVGKVLKRQLPLE